MEKRGIVQDYIVWIIIAVAFLVLMGVLIFMFKEKGIELIKSIINKFRFR